MSLENFRVPRTPESRTPYVLGLLGVLGAVSLAWTAFIGSSYSVEILLVSVAAAIGYVVWRYVRQPVSGRSRR
jgi:hypothetical protein